MLEKFLEALDEDKEYEFISNYYNEMSKFDLRTILLEYIFMSKRVDEESSEAIIDEVRESLEDSLCKL